MLKPLQSSHLLIALSLFVASSSLLRVHRPVGAQEEKASWHQGNAIARQLDAPVDFRWSAVPLRRAIDRLAKTTRVAMFLDRRVDPNQSIELNANQVSLREALGRLAERTGCQTAMLGTVVYIGPPGTSEQIPLLIESARKNYRRIPISRRHEVRRPMNWPALSEPRILLSETARQSAIRLEGLENVAHDLWPAIDLPPMDVVETLTLLTYGFNLTFEFAAAGDIARIKPIAQDMFVATIDDRHTHRSPLVAGRNGLESNTAETAKAETLDQKRFTLTFRGHSAEELIQLLARKYALTVDIDPALKPHLDRTISIEVTQATFDQLLREALSPLQLEHERRGGILTIRQKSQ